MAEQVFFDKGDVKVTQARFVVGDQMYTMQGVTSIRHLLENPSRKGPIIAMVVGIIVTLTSFGALSDSIGEGFVALLIGLAILGLGVLWFRSRKATFIIVLHSASGETRALADNDESLIKQIVGALNDAIVARG